MIDEHGKPVPPIPTPKCDDIMLYLPWVEIPTWTLRETVDLLKGYDPKGPIHLYLTQPENKKLAGKFQRLLELFERYVGTEKLQSVDEDLCGQRFPVEQILKVAERINGIEIPSGLAQALTQTEVLREKSTPSKVRAKVVHGNAERYSSEREQVLMAAVWVLANHYKQCCGDDGKAKGQRIAELIDDHARKWWKGGKPPRTVRMMRELVNQALRVPD